MPAGTYAVVRYIPDPARDEPINMGIIAGGPAGAVFKTDPVALDRIRLVDPYVDAATIPHVTDYVERLVSEPALRFSVSGPEEIEPWSPAFIDALRDQLPERFTLGRSLFIEYADESRAAMEDAAADLVVRLVKPITRKPVFPRNPGAPFEQMKKLLAPAIKQGQVRVQADIQGRLTHRVRQPDFFYRDRHGHEVVIEMIKLTQQRRHNISQTADAKAFELLDLKQRPGVQTIAVVEQPETPTTAFLDAVQSIKAVAHEIIDPREGMTTLAERVRQDLALAPA